MDIYALSVAEDLLSINGYEDMENISLSEGMQVYNLNGEQENKNIYFVSYTDKLVALLVVAHIDNEYYAALEIGVPKDIVDIYREGIPFALCNYNGCLIVHTDDKDIVVKNDSELIVKTDDLDYNFSCTLSTGTYANLFLVSCAANEKSKESNDIINKEISESVEGAEIVLSEACGDSITDNNNEDITDVLPNMIYYNDTLYYKKEELFVFEGLRASQIADNYECIGHVEKIVSSNERPTENLSANCGGAYLDGKFPLYKFDEDTEEFLTTFDGNIQIWYTEAEYNKNVR